MTSIATVIFCNCAIAMVILAIALWTIQFRKQIVALTNWCDRWTMACDKLNQTNSSPLSTKSLSASIAASSENILALRQLYQQQLRTLDLIRSIGSIVSFARYLSTRKPSGRF